MGPVPAPEPMPHYFNSLEEPWRGLTPGVEGTESGLVSWPVVAQHFRISSLLLTTYGSCWVLVSPR